MKLPRLKYSARTRKTQQVRFRGLNHTVGARDGEIWDMRNMCSDHYPVLATREKRLKYKELRNGQDLYCWKELCWVDGNRFFYAGEDKGQVTPGDKSFAALGEIIAIFPDKAYYDTERDVFGSLESEKSGSVRFGDGNIFGVPAKRNVISSEGVLWEQYFRAGDAVTISGCTAHKENNKTIIIREIRGSKLVFYEESFTLDGENGDMPYTEPGQVTIGRKLPDIKYVCENENRLWGCDNNTIYACKLGDAFNWNVFDGLATDSYAVDTGSAGYFTGCYSYSGYPVFFKEDHIYKVYGSLPSNFEVMSSASLGLAPGSSRSLAVAGETLYYLSTSGVMAYSGGIPQPISAAFGTERFSEAVAGSDGLKYYMSCRHEDGSRRLHVYDSQKRVWHTEDETAAKGFANYRGNLYMMDGEGNIWITGQIVNPPEEAVPEEDVKWWVEFSDFTDSSPDMKDVSKLQIRLEMEPGAAVKALLRFDAGDWQEAGHIINENRKKSCYLPIVPRRGDHYRLRLEGEGGCQIYSISREYHTGTEF